MGWFYMHTHTMRRTFDGLVPGSDMQCLLVKCSSMEIQIFEITNMHFSDWPGVCAVQRLLLVVALQQLQNLPLSYMTLVNRER